MSGGGVTGCPHLLRGQVSAHQVIIPGKRVSGLHELEALTRHLCEDPSVHRRGSRALHLHSTCWSEALSMSIGHPAAAEISAGFCFLLSVESALGEAGLAITQSAQQALGVPVQRSTAVIKAGRGSGLICAPSPHLWAPLRCSGLRFFSVGRTRVLFQDVSSVETQRCLSSTLGWRGLCKAGREHPAEVSNMAETSWSSPVSREEFKKPR